MRVNFKKLLSIALTAVYILSSANVGTLAAPKAGRVKQLNAWGGEKTYIEPPNFNAYGQKVPKKANGVFEGDIVLDFGGNWTYKKGEKGSDKAQVFKPKEHYFPKLTITKIYNNQSTVLTKDNKKHNGYEEDHTNGGNYIRLWGCFKDVTNDKVVQFKFHDGTGTFQDIITKIQKKGESNYALLSVSYQEPDSNAGGETGEKCTISFEYSGKYEEPAAQTVSKGEMVKDPKLADVASWYVKGYADWSWDFESQKVNRSYTLVAVLKKEIPVESEIWLCKPEGHEKKYVSVLYQYEDDGKDYIKDLKESDKKKVIIRTDKGKPNMFFFSMQLEEGEKKQTLNSKDYGSSEITIQRQDQDNLSIKGYRHLSQLCSVQFQNENEDLINSELPNFKIQERKNVVTTLTAPIRYIKKGNKITLAPELKEGYHWVKVENGNLTNQVFTLDQDTVNENLVLRAVKKQDKKTFPVSFKSWDGKEDLVDSQEVEEGKKIQDPKVAQIVAWYTKDKLGTAKKYDFSDSTITSNLFLYGARGYTITLKDSDEGEIGEVKVSDAEPKIPADKLKGYNRENIEYWYVKGTDPEKTENQINLAEYSATADVTLIGKKKPPVAEKEVPAIKSACIYPETDKVTIEYVAGSEYIGKITEVESTREEDENENLLEDASSVSREGNKITISGDFEETLIYTIKAEGYKENQIAVEKEGDNDPAFIRDESSTGMTDLYSVKFVKDDGSAVDDCIYYLPKGKTLKEVGFTVPTLPIGYEKWVDSNNTEFTEDTAVEQDLVLTAEKSEQNTYIPVTLMYQNQSTTLNILKGNTIDSDVISEATKDWTDDVVGEKLKIASWKIKDGASFDITNTKITEAITLVAVPCQKWTVTFKSEGEEDLVIKVYNEDTITLPEELKEKADKWYLENNEEFGFGTTKITANTTITGKKNVVDPEPQEPQPQEPSYTPDYTASIFIEPIVESSTADTATTRTTDNNSVTISDDSTPLSAGEMARIRAMLESYKEIRMKDIDAKGYNKLMKAYTKVVKKIKSRKGTDKEIAELYKKLQENKKKYVKMDCNIKRLNMAVIKGKNKKQLLALIKKLDKYVAAKYKETVFANLFKKYDKAIKALNNETISDRKLDIIYNDLIKEKKDADKSLKK